MNTPTVTQDKLKSRLLGARLMRLAARLAIVACSIIMISIMATGASGALVIGQVVLMLACIATCAVISVLCDKRILALSSARVDE